MLAWGGSLSQIRTHIMRFFASQIGFLPAFPPPLLLLFISTSLGCTHVQLRNSTVSQARTLSDIYQQQVIDNLALFIYDPGALPHFAFANQGTTTIADQGTLALMNGWGRNAGFPLLFSTEQLNPTLQRNAQEAWTLTPVTDPRKLELMRCAYQKTVSAFGLPGASGTCPDCEKCFRRFYADSDAAQSGGAVTSSCLGRGRWFGVGCQKCAPKHGCRFVGHYCDIYVWTLPGFRNELAVLTLAVLDYAIHDAPAARTKQVVVSVDRHGVPVASDKHATQITADVRYDDLVPDSILAEPYLAEIDVFIEELNNQLRLTGDKKLRTDDVVRLSLENLSKIAAEAKATFAQDLLNKFREDLRKRRAEGKDDTGHEALVAVLAEIDETVEYIFHLRRRLDDLSKSLETKPEFLLKHRLKAKVLPPQAREGTQDLLRFQQQLNTVKVPTGK
jgi:hypothetical protein